ncbi:MAG: universal stress protein [Thermodesulfobacteriota bacterium]
MFKRILAPVDLSGRNERALRVAAELAAQRSGRLTLLHVIQRIDGLPAGELRGFYAQLEKAARRKLAAMAKRVAKDGLDVSCEVIVGEPMVDIVKWADRMRADVIVMASHRVEPKKGVQGLGTTSYKTAILCRCPILLVK